MRGWGVLLVLLLVACSREQLCERARPDFFAELEAHDQFLLRSVRAADAPSIEERQKRRKEKAEAEYLAACVALEGADFACLKDVSKLEAARDRFEERKKACPPMSAGDFDCLYAIQDAHEAEVGACEKSINTFVERFGYVAVGAPP